MQCSDNAIEYIAMTQGLIFEEASRRGYDLSAFIKFYMKSDFCNQEMDSEWSYFHFKPPVVCMSYLDGLDRVPMADGDGEILNPGWTGMMYRYLAFISKDSSRDIARRMPPAVLDSLAMAYETWEMYDAALDIYEKNYKGKV